MSLKFLNLKSFHPGNKRNQKRLYNAEQQEVENKKREEERAKEHLQEQEYIKNRAYVTGSKLEGERSKLSFMYSAPPGAKIEEIKDNSGNPDQHQEYKRDKDLKDSEKFPFLVNAPVQGSYSGNSGGDIKLVHKPFGIELRNVKCARCHTWGHKSGDRDCPLFDINIHDQKRLEKEDPLANIHSNNSNNSNHSNNHSHSNNNKPKRDKDDGQDNQDNHDNHETKRFRLNRGASSPTSYGGQSYDIIEEDEHKKQDSDSDSDDDDEIEREFLASLTKKQRKMILKQIKIDEKKAKKKKKKEKKKAKYHHRKRKREESNSNSSSDSDNSDSDSSSSDSSSSD